MENKRIYTIFLTLPLFNRCKYISIDFYSIKFIFITVLGAFWVFSIYILVVSVITVVLIFKKLNKWTIFLLIAAWIPVAIWLIAFLLLSLTAFGNLGSLKLLMPFIIVFVGIFIILKLMDWFISGR